MAISGTSAFFRDGAMEFLRGLAAEPPELRAAALERLFHSIDASEDHVVAAATIVGATSIGGEQFGERLAVLAAEDPALDARLPAPVMGLAYAAREALVPVADRWCHGRPDHAETIAALLQVLTLGGGVLDDLDVIWNDACDYGADGEAPEGTPLGVAHLAHLLRIHGSLMGGGLFFALEVNEPFRVRRAVEALHYFGLVEAAVLLEETLERSMKGEDSDSWPTDDHFDGLADGDVLERAFRAKAIEAPADFGCA